MLTSRRFRYDLIKFANEYDSGGVSCCHGHVISAVFTVAS